MMAIAADAYDMHDMPRQVALGRHASLFAYLPHTDICFLMMPASRCRACVFAIFTLPCCLYNMLPCHQPVVFGDDANIFRKRGRH